MTSPMPARLAPIARTATLELVRVIGGDALSHRYGFAIASRWSPDGARFAALVAPAEDSDEEQCAIVEFDALDGSCARAIDGIAPDAMGFALSPDGARSLLLRRDRATMRSLDGGADAELPCAVELYENTRLARFSPDGSYAMYATHRAALFLARKLASGQWSADRLALAQAPFALSADGSRYAHGAPDRRITVARASDGATMRSLDAAGEPLIALRFSASGALLLAAHQDGAVRCFELETGLERWRVAHGQPARDVGVDEEAERVWLAVLNSGELALDLRTGAILDVRTIKLDPDVRAPDVYAPSGRRALSVFGRELAIVDCRTATAADLHDGHSGAITAIAAAPDGSQFVTSSEDRTARSYRASDGALLWTFGELDAFDGIVEARYREDRPTLLTRGSYNELYAWDARSGVKLEAEPAPYAWAKKTGSDFPHTFKIAWCAPVIASDDYLIAGPESSSDYSSESARWAILRYDAVRGAVRWKHQDRASRDSLFALSPDGSTLVQCLRSGERRLFSTSDGALLDAPLTATRGPVYALAFTRAGALCVSDAQGLGWHADARATRQPCSSEPLFAPLAITRRGDRVAGVARDGRVSLRAIEDGAELDAIDLAAADDQCTALAWVDDDRALVVGTKRQLVLLFRAMT